MSKKLAALEQIKQLKRYFHLQQLMSEDAMSKSQKIFGKPQKITIGGRDPDPFDALFADPFGLEAITDPSIAEGPDFVPAKVTAWKDGMSGPGCFECGGHTVVRHMNSRFILLCEYHTHNHPKDSVKSWYLPATPPGDWPRSEVSTALLNPKGMTIL